MDRYHSGSIESEPVSGGQQWDRDSPVQIEADGHDEELSSVRGSSIAARIVQTDMGTLPRPVAR